jgi:hypothetical protein
MKRVVPAGCKIERMASTPKRTYEIRLSGQTVATREDIDPQLAVLDYLRSIGCEEDEIVRVGNDSASWRGALYTAVPAPDGDDVESRRTDS